MSHGERTGVQVAETPASSENDDPAALAAPLGPSKRPPLSMVADKSIDFQIQMHVQVGRSAVFGGSVREKGNKNYDSRKMIQIFSRVSLFAIVYLGRQHYTETKERNT